MVAIDWENVNIAGAFLLGTLFGTVVTLRILRIATGLIRKQRDEET